jgi:arachidonate 5-lipoxygenase
MINFKFLQVLENVGILKNIKRFAGASVGAMVASLAAIGISAAELQEFLDQDVRKIMAGKSSFYK